MLPPPAELQSSSSWLPPPYTSALLWTVCTAFLYLWNRHLLAQPDTVSLLTVSPAPDQLQTMRMHRKLAFPPLLVSALQTQATSVLAAIAALPALALRAPLLQPSRSPSASTWATGILVAGSLYAGETALMAKALQDAHVASVGFGRLPAGAIALVCRRLFAPRGRNGSPGLSALLLALIGGSLIVDAMVGGMGFGTLQAWQKGRTTLLFMLASMAATVRWALTQKLLFSSPALQAGRFQTRLNPLLLTACVALLASLCLVVASWVGEPHPGAKLTWHLLTGQWGEHGPPKRLPPIPSWSRWVPSTTTWAWLVLALIPSILQTSTWSTELALLKRVPLGLMVIYDVGRTVTSVAGAKLVLGEDTSPAPTPSTTLLVIRSIQSIIGIALFLAALLLSRQPATERVAPPDTLSKTKVASFGTFSLISAPNAMDSPSTSAMKTPEPPVQPGRTEHGHQLLEEVNALPWDQCGTTFYSDGLYEEEYA